MGLNPILSGSSHGSYFPLTLNYYSRHRLEDRSELIEPLIMRVMEIQVTLFGYRPRIYQQYHGC